MRKKWCPRRREEAVRKISISPGKENFKMKVVAFNGSPNKEGNTWHAIRLVTAEL
jgi:hypothetical protein